MLLSEWQQGVWQGGWGFGKNVRGNMSAVASRVVGRQHCRAALPKGLK